MNFKKNLLRVFSVNFIQTVANIIIGFVVPSILTIEGYASLKTYTLYMTYVGVLHLGFNDGIYLRYGGKEENKVETGELKGEHFVLFVSQLILTVLFLIFSVAIHNPVLILMTLSIVPANIFNFHKQYYQAVGNFKFYSFIMNISSIVYVMLNLLLVFLIKSKNFELYCCTTLLCNLIPLLIAEGVFYKKTRKNKMIVNKKRIKSTIKGGFLLMVGNLAAIFLYAIDKWFVKLFFTTADFSYYAFAVSMFNIVITFLNAICVTFYNLFAKEEIREFVKKVKMKLVFLGSLASSAYFALAVVVNLFLKNYIPSLSVIACTFATFPYLFVIKAVFVNLYKSRRLEKRYTRVVFLMLIIACLLNAVGMLLYKNIYVISIATLISFIIWFFISFIDFKYLKPSYKELLYLFLVTLTFLVCSHLNNNIINFFIYVLLCFIYNFFLLKVNFMELIKIKK